jgi:biotin carboxyl carrier protein
VTYSQPPAQPTVKPNRIALWLNTRKTAANQPDYKGNVEITWELLQEMLASFNAGRYATDMAGRPCLKLDVAVYAQPQEGNKPIMSGRLSTVAETEQSAAMREQARAQNGYAQQPAPMPQAPQGYSQQPQQYQQPAPQPAAPAPAAPNPLPAYPQAPAPAAATAPVAAPMPGAIHGQPPAAPMPQPVPQVPQGF